MKHAGLVLVALISALLFPSAYEAALPGHTPVAQASPSLSGAEPGVIYNGDFSVPGAGEVGTPPDNHDFATGSQSSGSAPGNFDFETGDFTGWTLTGSPTVASGGPTGYYAQLASGQKVESAAFTVGSDTQVLKFDIQAQSAGTFQVKVIILSGVGYGTSTTKFFTSCPTTCTNWNSYTIDAIPWQGQSIKVRVERYVGNLNVDNVAAQQETLSGWTVNDGTKVTLESGGPDGGYAKTATRITSEAYTVDDLAQNGEVQLKAESGSYDIYVLSGGSYTTETKVFSGNSTDSASWDTRTFGLGNWAGESVKIQVRPAGSSSVLVDNAGVAQNVVGGWSATDGPVALGNQGGIGYLSNVTLVKGQSLTMPFSCFPAGGGCATEYITVRITYRMKSNLSGGGFDYGSGLFVDYGGYRWWQTAGNNGGPPADPVNVWITDEFPITNIPGLDQPSNFQIWGTGTSICNPGCGNKPDVASIEIVGGSGQAKTVANPNVQARNILPPGLAGKALTSSSNDPVEFVTGNYYHSKTDLAVPGPGIPLTWTRSYSAQGTNNAIDALGPMGTKWAHNWQASLTEMGTDDVLIRLPMGASLMFFESSGTYTAEPGLEATLVKNGGGDWTLTTKEQYVYSFDAGGLWTAVEDRNGNETTLTYNGSDQLITITDAVGRDLDITYNIDGLIDEISDPAGRSVLYGYDANYNLDEVTDVMGETVTFDYQGALLTQATDAKGNVFVRNTYDAYGRVIEQLDANDGLTTFDYATPGAGANRITDQRGKVTTYYFDMQMRITDIEDDEGGVTSFVYDDDGNRSEVTNPLGETWEYTYDSDGNVLTATDPLSKTWTYTYNAFNDVLTVTDPLSKVTTFDYDVDGNLETVEDADEEVTTFTVDAMGLVTEIEDPLTNTVTFDYDAYGNRTEVTNGLAKTWLYTYDTAGRVMEVEDPLTHVSTFTYNAANLVTEVEDELEHSASYTYDENGNVLTVTDANENVTTYVYDDKDQLVSITDAEEQVWLFDYDEIGNLVEKTNPRGKVTTYLYDDLNRLVSETDPEENVRTYEYDEAGRLVSRTDPKEQEIVYTYNDRNELTNIAYPDMSTVAFSYNDAGARTQMVDATGTTIYAYDDLYRLTSVTYPGSRVVSYGYDAAGRRTSVTYPGGTDDVTYGYDAANRLTTVTDWDSNVTTYTYDDADRMTLVELPNGVESAYTYDDADRLTDIEHVLGMDTLAFVNYTLDAVGNRTERVDGQGTHTYGYDDVYRLVEVTYPGPSTTSYVYDGFGNRTEMTVGVDTTTYAYDDADRLVSVDPPAASPVAYTWDDNGNLTDRGADAFVWDFEDRLVEATVDSVTTTFAYRGDGLRDSRTVGMTTTTFTWDIAGGLPVVLDDGTNRYVYGPSGLVAQKTSTDDFYYLADGLGSTMAITDDTGDVVRDYTYDVYGAVTGGSGATPNEFDFAGQQSDDSTGLQYLRARYYDPATGIFISRDPLAAEPVWLHSPHGYASANPATLSDPSGLAEPGNTGCGPTGYDDDGAICTGGGGGIGGGGVGARPTSGSAGGAAGGKSGTAKPVTPNFQAYNFRANLKRLTGANPPKYIEAHHIFPQAEKFAAAWKRLGINIHDPRFGSWIPKTLHQVISRPYENAWLAWLLRHPNATVAEVMAQAEYLMAKFFNVVVKF